jgi:hypothetical protein
VSALSVTLEGVPSTIGVHVENADTMLYAWANPVSGTAWDHTWVTTYDNRSNHFQTIQQVIAASLDYWFCWGDYHASGSAPAHPDGFLGAMAGALDVARCLVQSNAPSASTSPTCGTIYYYGVDGVCHQLANQALWATKGPAAGPLTMSNARGYHLSSFMFGTYGRQTIDWKAKMASCGPAMVNSMNQDDEFETHARQVLLGTEAEKKLGPLLDLRAEALAAVARFKTRARSKDMPDADELNRAYNEFFARAAKLLGPAAYHKVFGVKATEEPNLVDPAVARTSSRKPTNKRRT